MKKKSKPQSRPSSYRPSPTQPNGHLAIYEDAVRAFKQGDFSKAESLAMEILRLKPDFAQALNILAMTRHHAGRLAEAEELLARAVKSAPNVAFLHGNRCGLLISLGRYEEAVVAGERALELHPDDVGAANNLGNALLDSKRFARAQDVFESVVSKRPDHLNALKQGVSAARMLGDFQASDRWRERVAALFGPEHAFSAGNLQDYLNLAYTDVVQPLPPGLFDRLTQVADRIMATGVQDAPPLPPPPPALADGRFRLGFLSAKLGDHPVGHVTRDLYRSFDRNRFEIHGFSLKNRLDEAAAFARDVRDGCDFFHDLSGLRPLDAALAIRAQGIDVLAFLDGFMTPLGLEILAWRPAPIQIFWLGHAGGLGLSCIDALLADRVVLPPEVVPTYREPILWLPPSYHCALPQAVADLAPSRLECGLPGKGAVFCAFNNPEKIDRTTFELWMEILRAVPESALWLSNLFDVPELEANLRRAAEALGVSGDRLVFAKRLPDKAEHLARHVHADLLLDTLTLNASTTALDALWAGLPVLTTPGIRFGSRIAASMLTCLGLPELICPSPREFAARAVSLASDPSALQALKLRLRERIESSSFFRIERSARVLEEAFLALLERRRARGAAVAT